MPINRFRSDAPAKSKIIRLLGPGGAGVVSAEITCGNRKFEFPQWSPTQIVATLQNAGVPEFANLVFSVSSQDVIVTGPVDDDFIIGLSYRPTITVTNEFGQDPVNQITQLSFDGARAGTYALTINGKTTGNIGYGNSNALITAIEALSGWTAGDAIVLSFEPDVVLIEFRGTLAGAPVAVTMDASGLHNGRTVTIRESLPYRPGPHDVYELELTSSTTCSVTIDGSSATIRSDDSLETVSQRLKTLSARKLNVYGGDAGTADSEGVRNCKFVLDFEGWTRTTRPTVSVSASDGSARVAVLSNPASSTGWNGALVSSGTIGQCNQWLLDFTTGSTIELEYDGLPVTLEAPETVVDIAATVGDYRNSIRDVSEYDECMADYGALFGSSPLAVASLYIAYLINTNDTIRQTGGTGTLRRLNYAGADAAGAVHSVNVPAGTTSSGTFRLEFPEGTIDAVSGTVSDTDLETEVSGLIASTTVSGDGTPADPWLISYPSALGPRVLPVAVEVGLSGNGTGIASTYRSSLRSRTQRARVTISNNAVSGTFKLKYGNEGPVTITLNDSASTFEAALATMPGIASAGNIVGTYDADSQSYNIVFSGGTLADKKLPALSLASNDLDVIAATTIDVIQKATGPRNIAEPLNWSLGRIPHALDEIVFEAAVGDAIYGLRQWVKVTAATSTEVLTATGGHDFRTGQVIRFLTAGTMPSGLSEGTDYYVIDADNETSTFRVSTTATGTAVNVTSTGSGDIYCGVLGTVREAASFSNQIGRSERTAQNSAEYLPRYFKVGIPLGGVLEIGAGAGRGSGLSRFDVGYSEGTIEIVRTDSSTEIDRPAVCILANSAVAAVELINGDLGIAAHDGESAAIGSLSQNAGTCFVGVASVAGNLTKQGGRLITRSLTVSGTIAMKG